MTELLLIDVSHLFWSNWHATADQEIGAAYQRTIEHVQRLVERHSHAAVCCDWPPYMRKLLYDAYKAQRDKPEPAAIEQFTRVKERIGVDGHVVWQSRGFEADDIIAGAVAWATNGAGFDRVVIASNDKDILQLVGPRCVMLSTRTGETVDVAGVEAKFGVPPEKMRDLLALTGDKSDNIPGVPSIGPKRAAAILAEYGTLDALLAVLDSDPDAVQPDKLRDLLVANRKQLELSQRLVTLRTDAAIDYEAVFAERVARPLSAGVTDAQWEDVDKRDDLADQEEPTMATEQEDSNPQQSEPTNGNGNGVEIEVHDAPSTALARVEPQDFSLALEPNSLGAALKLARGLYESRLYQRFGNPEAIWAVIIRGRELGLGALTALDTFHVIEGKPAMHAHLIIARAAKHPDCEYFQCIESTETTCTYETKNRRNPKPTRHTYTLKQAQQAGLAPEVIRASRAGSDGKDSRSQWEKRPTEQLRKTCGVQLARIEYPEAAMGLFCPEELSQDGPA